jgi:hypothetical protein
MKRIKAWGCLQVEQLNRLLNQYPRKVLKGVFIIGLSLLVIGQFWLLYGSLHQNIQVRVGSIKVSRYVITTDSLISHQRYPAEYQRMRYYKHYLDSIKIHAPKRWDSISRYRPHLVDSIDRIISFYTKKDSIIP